MTIDIHRLRAYGRSIGVARPAAKDKEELIEDILSILACEVKPTERSKRGAPVKNDVVDERIPSKLAEITAECFINEVLVDVPEFDLGKEYKKMMDRTGGPLILTVNDPSVEREGSVSHALSRGQVVYADGEYLFFWEDGSEPENKILIPTDCVTQYDLRDGDMIACYFREKGDLKKFEKLVSVNGVAITFLKERPHFEDCTACYSKAPVRFFDGWKHIDVVNKYMDWLVPLTYGQRACVVSAPKEGKTRMILSLANAAESLNRDAEVLLFLIDQPPETIGEFRRIYGNKGLIYTTYDDDADRQVFLADFVLKRAKRYAEMGKTVVLFVDSLTALARAFNDTEASMGGKTLPCGLEVKTIHYLKKYLGTARCFEEGGSITILGSLNCATGNPMDDIVARELLEFSTLKVELSDDLALKRVYPAIDIEKTQGKYNEMVKTEEEMKTEFLFKNKVLSQVGLEAALNILKQSSSEEEFAKMVDDLAKQM